MESTNDEKRKNRYTGNNHNKQNQSLYEITWTAVLAKGATKNEVRDQYEESNYQYEEANNKKI